MRFYKYLNEAKKSDINKLINDCKSFLTEWNKTNNFNSLVLYRGLKNVGTDTYKLLKTDKNREPKDSDIHVHRYANTVLKQKTGYLLRSESVFCTSEVVRARDYGRAYGVLPVGSSYKIFQNPIVADMYDIFSDITPSRYNLSKVIYCKKLGADYVQMLTKAKIAEVDDRSLTPAILLRPDNVIRSRSKLIPIIKETMENNKFYVDPKGWKYLLSKYTEVPSEYKELITAEEVYTTILEPFYKEALQLITSVLEKTKQVSLSEADKCPNEIMLICDEYYIVDEIYFGDELGAKLDKLFR